MRLASLLAVVLVAAPAVADHLVLSGMGAGAEVVNDWINPNTFFFQFIEYTPDQLFWEIPPIAEGSTSDTIPVPYPESQVWTITAANAGDFDLDWNALADAFADPQELSLRFGMGFHPGTGAPTGQAWPAVHLGLVNGAFTRDYITRNGVMIQDKFRDSPDWPGWSLVTLDVESIQFEREFYDRATCSYFWCGGKSEILSHVRWTVTGEGQLAGNPPPPVEPERNIPEPSVAILLLSLFASHGMIRYRRYS